MEWSFYSKGTLVYRKIKKKVGKPLFKTSRKLKKTAKKLDDFAKRRTILSNLLTVRCVLYLV